MAVLLLLLSTFISAITLLLIRLLWPKRKQWLVARKLPGPTALPLIGNILEIAGDRHHSFTTLVRLITAYGTTFRMWFGPKLFIVLSDPVDIQIILGDARIRNRDYVITKAMVPFIGNGLLASRDELWRAHRKLITPTFHFRVLRTYVEVFGRKAEALCAALEEFGDGAATVDIHKYVSMCTMDAICETAIGIEMDVRSGAGMDFYHGVVQANDLGHNRVTHPWKLLRWLYPLTSDGKQAALLDKKVFGFTDTLVAKKLAEYRARKQAPAKIAADAAGLESEFTGRKKVRTLLEMMIEASENEGSLLTVKEMRDELTTIAAAGFDTTAISISNLLLLIGLNPHVQDKISQELDSIFSGDLRPATTEDINRMEYLERAFKEALRLFPVVPLLFREISEDVVLASGQVIPAGCTTLTFSYMVHRDPRYFPDPDRFEPDRWLPSEPVTGSSDSSRRLERHPYCYLPFSAGPRNCIGQKYAALQMKSIVSSLLRRFTVAHRFTNEDLKNIDVSAATRLAGNYNIQLTRK